jgi:hypothetical protein
MRAAKEIKVKLTLSDEDRKTIKSILTKGIKSVRVIKRAMVCSDPPEGRKRWTLELLKEEAMNRQIVKTVGRDLY